MNTNFSYDRMDYYATLEYLKKQATFFSDGAWTDFSDGDIGTVLLKLMSMNSDLTNFQIEKGISELYLDTVMERVNAIALCKLIGYEPRHYHSAFVELSLTYNDKYESDLIIPKYTRFTDKTGDISYFNIEDIKIVNGINNFKVYQGSVRSFEYTLDSINDEGKLKLEDYNVGVNTLSVRQASLNFTQTENALYGEGENCYSVHIDLDNSLYIQFPTYYQTILSPNTPILVDYLVTDGEGGKIGANVLEGVVQLSNGVSCKYGNIASSEGGYDPESIEEIRKDAPAFASTMDTLVTLDDFRNLATGFNGIADVMALDYNFKESGLIQPYKTTVNDAYKVNLYILPENADSIWKKVKQENIGGNYMSKDEFITSDSGDYHFEYDEENKTFTSTNHIADTSCSLSLWSTGSYKKIRIEYEVSCEEDFDYFYLTVNGDEVAQVSGQQSGSYTIEDKENLRQIAINISYVKDSTETKGKDNVVVKFYGITEEETEYYTQEYLDEVDNYIRDVKKKKPAGIFMTYLDVTYIRPHLTLKVYMDEEDLRFATAPDTIADFIAETYSRKYKKIGEPIYMSHISKEVLQEFDFINYLEVIELENSKDGAIKPNRTQFVELLKENIAVKVVPYEEK